MTTQLQELLGSVGLTRVSGKLEQVALPSIRLRAHTVDETQLKPGITRFGSTPDFPQGWVWPERNGSALPFVGQINLSEIAPYIRESLLPDSGILYFFFDVDTFFETWPHDRTTWSVLYDGSALSALRPVAIPETIARKRRYRPSPVTLATEITLPDYSQYDSTSLQRLGLRKPLTDEEELAYYQVQAQLAQRAGVQRHIPIHRFLGHADPVQWDMQSELAEKGGDWQLLLQVDSDAAPDMDWGDTGRIYYWIRKQDLVQCNFSQVQLILQCT